MRLRFVAVPVVGTYLSMTCGGCVSNEYVIPTSELARLAGLPPSQRGARVHVIQELGSREQYAVDNGDPAPDANYGNDFAIYDRPDELAELTGRFDVQTLLGAGPGGTAGPRPVPSPWPHPLSRSPHGSAAGGERGRGSGSGGNWSPSLNFNGGGGSGGDELVIIAIVVVAVALMAAVGLSVTEGLRYDGFVQLHPEQPVHLEQRGGIRTLTLAALTPADVVATREAVVMDDEDWGFRFGNRRPLDRKGAAFKVDIGALDSWCACYSASGVASNVEVGYFFHHRIGLLAGLSLGGGTSDLNHTFQRHSAKLEAQAFPLSWWRLHLGLFGHGGVQVARDEFGTRDGPAWGGGLLLEIALTTRLALMGRADYTIARTAPDDGGWAGSSMIAAGLAIY